MHNQPTAQICHGKLTSILSDGKIRNLPFSIIATINQYKLENLEVKVLNSRCVKNYHILLIGLTALRSGPSNLEERSFGTRGFKQSLFQLQRTSSETLLERSKVTLRKAL